jgi:OOP family OmpA-OmpF porin
MPNRTHVYGLLCLCLILFFAAASAKAGKKPVSMHLSPGIGGYVFEGNQDIDHGPAYGLRLGASFSEHWEEELSLFFIDTESDNGEGDIDGYLYRLEGIYNFLPDSRLTPFTAAGIGGITLDPDNGSSSTRFLVNYGGGLNFDLTQSLALRGDIRHIVSFNDVQSNLLYSLGLTYTFGGPEPVRAEPAQAEPAPTDSDGDGVVDGSDRCPNTPAGVKVDSAGCPVDSDKDGVADYQDTCPNTQAGVAVDDKGCPPDSDNDGVADFLDECPGTPSQAEVDSQGCPRDTDGDGVANYRDKCPDTPQGASVNADGCWIAGIKFETDSAAIQSEYRENLSEVMDLLQSAPEMRLEIQGHTDSVGSEEYNRTLSQRRARAVKEYFVQRGINADRLKAVGYGESQPTASNETEAGRARNRRVQLEPMD